MTDQKAAGEVEAKAEAACLAWMRESNDDSATGDEMRAFEAGYEAACHQRDQRIAELEEELADWRLVKDEPVVAGRLAVIKAAKPKRMISVGRFPITPVTPADDRLPQALPVCTRCGEYLPKIDGLCPKCIQRGPAAACLCQPGGSDAAGHMPSCRQSQANEYGPVPRITAESSDEAWSAACKVYIGGQSGARYEPKDAIREAAKLEGKRELLAEIRQAVRISKWSAPTGNGKEATWGRAYAEVMARLEAEAKYNPATETQPAQDGERR